MSDSEQGAAGAQPDGQQEQNGPGAGSPGPEAVANADTGTPAPSVAEGKPDAPESQETTIMGEGAGLTGPGGGQPGGPEGEGAKAEPLPVQRAAQAGVPVKEGETVHTIGTEPEPGATLEQRDQTEPVKPEHWLDGEPKPGQQHADTR